MIPKLLIGIAVPLIVAELIFNLRSEKAKSAYRLWVLIPMVAPGVVVTLIWDYIYDPNFGILTAIWQMVGGEPVDWLHNSNTVIPAIIFMGFPWIGGTNVLIYISGLNAVSAEAEGKRAAGRGGDLSDHLEHRPAADSGQMRFFLINGLIGGIQDYSVQFLLTDGGPGYDTMVPDTICIRRRFSRGAWASQALSALSSSSSS